MVFALASQAAYALPTTGPDGQASGSGSKAQTQSQAQAQTDKNQAQDQAIYKSLQKNPIIRDIQDLVNFLSAGVGLVVVAMIIMGGIQYSAAGDNSQKVTDAKKRITNALLALLAFIFLFSFVQWLIPGGIFS